MFDVTENIRNLIRYYIQRQHIVCLAMLDLAPDILTAGGDSLFGIKLAPYVEVYANRIALITDFREIQQGIWKNEWKYNLHGIGCRLINLTTGEPLEWDVPNPESFRLEWFWEHLMWRREHDQNDVFVQKLMIDSYASLLFETNNILTIDRNGIHKLLG